MLKMQCDNSLYLSPRNGFTEKRREILKSARSLARLGASRDDSTPASLERSHKQLSAGRAAGPGPPPQLSDLEPAAPAPRNIRHQYRGRVYFFSNSFVDCPVEYAHYQKRITEGAPAPRAFSYIFFDRPLASMKSLTITRLHTYGDLISPRPAMGVVGEIATLEAMLALVERQLYDHTLASEPIAGPCK
ncbi:hypothetical protein EVAR_9336_1 [Eumeta japonica]|uniref:Uncharacterized protein n=1 Tax=Eumeta variegata TaxID=151549 RepID=A0A4C1YT17_EUMVA|nr:hypothetical protein EVAR_9336_1 [Eumeta japonica]